MGYEIIIIMLTLAGDRESCHVKLLIHPQLNIINYFYC